MGEEDDKVLEVDAYGNETTQADLDEALATADSFTAEQWEFARQWFTASGLIAHHPDAHALMRKSLESMPASAAIFIVTCVKGRLGIEHAPPGFVEPWVKGGSA